MKKTLSLFLILSMLLSCCVLFSSCSKVSEKDVQKDAQAVLAEAFENTTDDFFPDDADILDVIEDALRSGSVSLSVESDSLMGDVKKISETLYMNEKDNRVVSDTKVTYGSEELAARIYLDQKGLILNSESVLGSATSYAANLSTLTSQLSGSALAELLQLKEEELAELTRSLNTLKTELEKDRDTAKEDAEEKMNAYLALLAQTTGEETTVNAEGKEVKCIVVGYMLNKDTLRALMDRIYSDQGMTAEEKEKALKEFDEITKSMTLNLSFKLFINKKTSALVKITLSGSLNTGLQETALNGSLQFGEKEISLTAEMTAGGETTALTAKLTKETSRDATTYKAELKVKSGDVELNLLNATYTYNKDTGAFVLSLDLYNEEGPRTTFSIEGSFTVNRNDATIAITSVKTPDATVSIKITLAFTAKAETPAAPTDAKDVVTLTKEDWQNVIRSFQNSKLGKILSSAML